MSKPKIVIVMDGGIIQHILADTKNVEIALIDYDIEGMEEEKLTDIPQTEQLLGAKEKAYCWHMDGPDEVNASRVADLFSVIRGEAKETA
jgi:hypothetical protein